MVCSGVLQMLLGFNVDAGGQLRRCVRSMCIFYKTNTQLLFGVFILTGAAAGGMGGGVVSSPAVTQATYTAAQHLRVFLAFRCVSFTLGKRVLMH